MARVYARARDRGSRTLSELEHFFGGTFTVYSLQFTVVISPPRTIGRRFTSPRTGGRQISSARLALTLNFGYSPVRGPSRGPRFAAVTFSGGQRRARVQTMPRRPGYATTLAVKTIHANPVSPDSEEPGGCESHGKMLIVSLLCSGCQLNDVM